MYEFLLKYPYPVVWYRRYRIWMTHLNERIDSGIRESFDDAMEYGDLLRKAKVLASSRTSCTMIFARVTILVLGRMHEPHHRSQVESCHFIAWEAESYDEPSKLTLSATRNAREMSTCRDCSLHYKWEGLAHEAYAAFDVPDNLFQYQRSLHAGDACRLTMQICSAVLLSDHPARGAYAGN